VCCVSAGSSSTDYPKWIQHANRVFDVATEGISDYYEYLDDEDKRKGAALEVLEWLREKRAVLVDGCMLEGGKTGEECDDLWRLERLVTDLENESGVEDMVHVLICQCHAERGTLNRPTGMLETPLSESTLKDHMLPTEDELKLIFQAMDTDGDGRVNIMAFTDAMSKMGDTLSPNSLENISVAFDLHGSMDFEQFKEIVSAEELRPHTSDIRALRRMIAPDRTEHTPDWGT